MSSAPAISCGLRPAAAAPFSRPSRTNRSASRPQLEAVSCSTASQLRPGGRQLPTFQTTTNTVPLTGRKYTAGVMCKAADSSAQIDSSPLETGDKKKIFAEFLLQAGFNFLSSGAAAMAAVSFGGNPAHATLAVMGAHMVIVPLLMSIFAPLSGAHFNPMISIVMVFTGMLKVKTGIGYVLAQCAGGILRTKALWSCLPPNLQDVQYIGAQAVPADRTILQAFGGDVLASFFLMFGVFALVVDKRGWGKLGPFAVAAIIATNMWIFGSISSACMNPARALGPAFVAGFWQHHWIWWTAPFIGGLAAGVVYKTMFLET